MANDDGGGGGGGGAVVVVVVLVVVVVDVVDVVDVVLVVGVLVVDVVLVVGVLVADVDPTGNVNRMGPNLVGEDTGCLMPVGPLPDVVVVDPDFAPPVAGASDPAVEPPPEPFVPVALFVCPVP
ncbi:MAG: hypothetical protein ACYDA2_10385 [Acidimicrobiales bacterium]